MDSDKKYRILKQMNATWFNIISYSLRPIRLVLQQGLAHTRCAINLLYIGVSFTNIFDNFYNVLINNFYHEKHLFDKHFKELYDYLYTILMILKWYILFYEWEKIYH